MAKKDGAKKSGGNSGSGKTKKAVDFFSAKNAPVLVAIVLISIGVLLAMTPAPRSSRGGPMGQGGDGGNSGEQKKGSIQDAVDAIHKARDNPEFTAEVLLSVMSRFYSVYLGGPIPAAVQAHAQTEEGKPSQGWGAARPSAFKAFAFASDHPAPSKAKGAKAHNEALQRQVITEAHLNMIARAGDKVFIDQNCGYGGGSAEEVAERCKVLTGYGVECVAWTDANEEAVNTELAKYVAPKAAVEGEAEAPAEFEAPAATVFVVAGSQRLSGLGIVNADPNAPDAKPLSKVLHVLFAGPPQTKEQRQELQRQQMAAREQFEKTPNPPATTEGEAGLAGSADAAAAPAADA